MELYILSKQDLSILSICKLADYQINLDEETNAKSTFTLMKTNGLKKENYMVLNGLYRQFIFVIDDVQTEKESDVVTVTALDISNIFDRKVIEKNIDTMKSKSIEEFLANTISENFVNSDDTALNVNYIEIYWHTNTQGNVATNAENGLYNFHTFLTNCRQYKNIYTDFKLENLGNPQTVEGKRINVDAKNRKIVDIILEGESHQVTRSGKNYFNASQIHSSTNIVVSDNGKTITMPIATSGNGYTQVGTKLKGVCPKLEVGDTVYLLGDTTSQKNKIIYLGGNSKFVWEFGKSRTITENDLNASFVLYGNNFEKGETEQVIISNLMITKENNNTWEQYGASPSPVYPSEIENLEGKNKFSGWVKGIAINATDGHQLADETRASSDYIAVDFNQNPNYYLSGLANTLQTFVAAYNSNKEFLGRTAALLVSYFSLNSSSFIEGTAQGTGDIAYLRVTTYENTPSGTTGAIDDVDNLETQLEEGTVATPYVPYNSLEFKDEGKNKFNVQDTNSVTEGITVDNEGWITVTGDNTNGTATKFFNYYTNNLNLKTGTNYNVIAEVKNVSGTGNINFVSVNANAKQFQSTFNKNFSVLANNTIYNSINKTADEFVGNNGLRTYIGFSAGQSGSITFRLSVLEDITITPENFDYEPYKSQVAYFPLGEEKLMEGSYLADDEIHHNFKEGLANGTSTTFEDAKENGKFYCNQKASGNLEGKTIAFDTEVTDAIVQYELAEPEIVPYTVEQQEAWNKIKNLTLFEGVNHISSDANMVLKYYPLEPVGLKFALRIDIENKQETTELIDTTLPEVADYNKIYEEDVTAKVQVYIREDGSEYNLYLKTDRTTTTNKDDPDRASGKIEVISVETADKAEEEALNVMKGNNYKHLVEFKITKTSKLMDITKLHIRKTYKNQNRRRYI